MDFNIEHIKIIDEYNKLTLILKTFQDILTQIRDKKEFSEISLIYKEKIEKYNNLTKYFNKNEEHTLLFLTLNDYNNLTLNKDENNNKSKNLIETKFMETLEVEIKKFIKKKKNIMNQIKFDYKINNTNSNTYTNHKDDLNSKIEVYETVINLLHKNFDLLNDIYKYYKFNTIDIENNKLEGYFEEMDLIYNKFE